MRADGLWKNKYQELVENHLIEWKQMEKDGKLTWQVYQKFYLENRTKQAGESLDGN